MTRVFIFAGQSNAQGYGVSVQLAPVPTWARNPANGWTGAPTSSSDSGVQYAAPTQGNLPYLYVDSNSGVAANTPGAWLPCPNFGESSYGPEISFLWRYRADNPADDVAVVKCVLGGSSLEHDWTGAPSGSSVPDTLDPANWRGGMWSILQTMLAQAATRLVAAGQTVEWAGLIWMQGESGASGPYYFVNPSQYGIAVPTYAQYLRSFLGAVRALTSPSLPCAVGRIADTMLLDDIILPLVAAPYTADDYRGATNQRRAEQVAVGGDPQNAWWSNDGYAQRNQGGNPAYWYHWTDPNYLAAGERAYAAWQQAAGITPPPPPPPLVVTFNGQPQAWSVSLDGKPVGGPGDTISIVG
jgi:hypothetical protein